MFKSSRFIKPFAFLLIQPLFITGCDKTVNSDELSNDEVVYHEFIINYNQEEQSLYAEAELTRQKKNNSKNWFEIRNYDYIKLVGEDELKFHVMDKEDLTYVLKPTKLKMDRRQPYLWSRTVPYYRLSKKINIEDVADKTMVFSYYNSSDSRTYTYETEVLIPNLTSIETSNGTILDTSNDDLLTLNFDENIEKFDVINLEFVNSQGNSFFFSLHPADTTEFIISSAELRKQALHQSYTIKERRKKNIGNLRIDSKKEKDIPLLLAGVTKYKMHISAKRLVEEERIYADKEHEISVYQNIKVYEKEIEIGF